MQTVQIRIPEDLVKKADEVIKKGLFRSRSHLLREALGKYLQNLNHIGIMPYIVGPFTPEEITLLKSNPSNLLQVPSDKLSKVDEELKKLNLG